MVKNERSVGRIDNIESEYRKYVFAEKYEMERNWIA